MLNSPVLATASKGVAQTAKGFLAHFMSELASAPIDTEVSSEWLTYLTATGAWTGTDSQLQAKAPGLVHLIAGSPEYQFQ